MFVGYFFSKFYYLKVPNCWQINGTYVIIHLNKLYTKNKHNSMCQVSFYQTSSSNLHFVDTQIHCIL